jgi:hypothetical protein
MSDSKLTTAQVERFREIIVEMKELMDEAKRICRDGPRITQERAKAYCFGHISMALSDEHEYVGSDTNMEEIADELEAAAEPAPVCKKCGFTLDEDGYCTNEPCMFFDFTQDDESDTTPK